MSEAVWANLRTLWRDSRIKGLERLFDTVLLVLRLLSLSYLLKRFLPEPDSPRRAVRSSVIDAYCVLELIVLVILVSANLGPVVETVIAAYILFDIYLNLLNIIFIGKIQAINAPPASVERSILLLLLNVLQVVFAFAIFYRHSLGLSGIDALFHAVLVLGTIGYPSGATGWPRLLVSLQVLLDLVLLLLILSSFVGHVTLFRRVVEPVRTPPSSDPPEPRASDGGSGQALHDSHDDLTPDDRKEARTYAWSYFALHADQRMKLFNFFLLLSGLILGAVPAVRGMAPRSKAVALLPLVLVVTAFIFWRLEERTRRLVKNAEDALQFLDKKWPVGQLHDGSPHYLRLFARDDHIMNGLRKQWWASRLVPISYSESFRIAYLVMGLVGAALAGWVWFA